MTSLPHAVGSIENALGNRDRTRTRDALTASGESRSQLYRRLRFEGAWDVAEEFKEAERARCRSAGLTKALAGVQAWDSIASAFPPADAETWNAFNSRSLRPPLLSKEDSFTTEAATLAGTWCCTMKLAACLATRCPQIETNCQPLLKAVEVRLGQEPLDGLMVNEVAISQLIEFMVSAPTQFLEQARTLFADYEPATTPYGTVVADELAKLIAFMELLPELIVGQWDKISPWLFGARRIEAERFLARACENQEELSSRIARRPR